MHAQSRTFFFFSGGWGEITCYAGLLVNFMYSGAHELGVDQRLFFTNLFITQVRSIYPTDIQKMAMSMSPNQHKENNVLGFVYTKVFLIHCYV